MKYIISMLLLVAITTLSFGQSFSGKVINAETKAPVEYASVFFVDMHVGTTTNTMGVFTYKGSIPVNSKIKVSALGYESVVVYYKSSDTLLIELKEVHLELKEVRISSATGALQKYSIANIESKTINELNAIQNTTLGEALSNIPGVYQSSTGTGISKPVIRGLSGMRVVTYVNGLRVENQQWGGDHGMGISENGIGSVEVIKGPSSLLYGADALGGVLYFVDESYAKQNQIESFVESQFETNSMRTKNFAGLKVSKNNFRFNLFSNYTNNADYQLANAMYAKNSRFDETNIKGALGYNRDKWVLNIRYNFTINHMGLPGHTHDSIITPELFQINKQQREQVIPVQIANNHFSMIENAFYFDKSELKILVGNTINRLTEYDEKVTIPGLDATLSNYTYNIIWKKKLGEKSNLITGAQGMFQKNNNDKKASETLIPDAKITDNGIYTVYQTEIKKWEAEAGFRLDSRQISTLGVFKGNLPFRELYHGLNYSAGVSRRYKYFMYRANVSSGYRPPHTSELLSNGVHHGTLRYEVGNTKLKSEIATQADVSIEYVSDHLGIIINPFYNNIKNYIYVNPADSLVEGLPLFFYEQANSARLMGGDVGFHYHPHFAHRLHVYSSFSYVRAEDESGNAMPLIPQTRINSTLSYEFESKKKVYIENASLQHLYFFAQDRVVAYETTSPSYSLLNMGINLKCNFKTPLYIKLGVKNIFNEGYIDHLSRLKNIGLEAPGRNYYISLKINLSRSINYNQSKTKNHENN